MVIHVLQVLFWISAGLIVHSYLGLFAMTRLLRKKPDWKPDPDYTPSITIVCAAYNEEKDIAQKIESTLAIDYPPDRVKLLIISDCSSDRTDEIVRSYDDPRVELVNFGVRLGKTRILNRVMQQVDSEITVLTDANVFFDAQSLRAMARWYADPRIGSVLGYERRYLPDHAESIQTEVQYRELEVRIERWRAPLARPWGLLEESTPFAPGYGARCLNIPLATMC